MRTNPTQFFTPKQFVKDFPGFVIYVGDREGEELRDFWIWQLDEDDEAELLRAEKGGLRYEDDRGVIIIELEEATAEVMPQAPEALQSGERAPLFTVGTTIELPLDQVLGRGESTKKTNRLTAQELVRVHRALKLENPRRSRCAAKFLPGIFARSFRKMWRRVSRLESRDVGDSARDPCRPKRRPTPISRWPLGYP